MGIQLEGGYETNDFWREVRAVGDQILNEYGYDEWTVTLRPCTSKKKSPLPRTSKMNWMSWMSWTVTVFRMLWCRDDAVLKKGWLLSTFLPFNWVWAIIR